MCRVFALLVVLRGVAGAGEPQVLSFDREVDGAVLAVSGLAWLTGNVLQPALVTRAGCDPCDPSSLSMLDRAIAGRWDHTADLVSWGLLGVVLAAPLIIDRVDVKFAGGNWRDWAEDAGVYLEALAVDGALNELVKLWAQRPRPFLYGTAAPDEARASPDAHLSFYSEHTSLAFTAAASWVTTFALRHRGSRGLVAAAALAAAALAGTTAALRMVAGKHFPSDVITGAAVGTAIGIGVPLLHARGGAPVRVAVAPVEGGATALITIIR
jgi:membrane-associated phospholipid phosphatase